eukprot:5105467-Pleurochrysis_carterae.AAC.1
MATLPVVSSDDEERGLAETIRDCGTEWSFAAELTEADIALFAELFQADGGAGECGSFCDDGGQQPFAGRKTSSISSGRERSGHDTGASSSSGRSRGTNAHASWAEAMAGAHCMDPGAQH